MYVYIYLLRDEVDRLLGVADLALDGVEERFDGVAARLLAGVVARLFGVLLDRTPLEDRDLEDSRQVGFPAGATATFGSAGDARDTDGSVVDSLAG